MARLVAGTTSNFLNVNTGANLAYPLTFSCRVKATTLASLTQPICYGEGFPNYDIDYCQFQPTAVHAYSGDGTTFIGAVFGGSFVVDQWYLIVCVYTSASIRRIYIDNSTQTAAHVTAVSKSGHASKNFTLGGVLTGASTISTGFAFNGHVADAAIWNVALSASDIDALVASRPDSVQYANLKGYWKLGEDGDLTSSAGTYGPMVVTGSCPVTTDPDYPSTSTFLNIPIHSPRKFTPNPPYLFAATDPTAPFADKLAFWFPATSPWGEYWNAKTGHGYVGFGSNEGQGNQSLIVQGEDNSMRRLPQAAQWCSGTALASGFTPYAWACWLKIYSFAGSAFTTFLQTVMSHLYWSSFGFMADGAANPRKLALQRNHGVGAAEAPSSVALPLDEWVHVALVFPYDNTVRYYHNGQHVGGGSSGNFLSTNSNDIEFFAVGGGAEAVLGHSSGNFAQKDVRVYNQLLSHEDINTVYHHSLDFHTATSDLIRTDIRPVRIEQALDYIPGEAGEFVLAGQAAGLSRTRKIYSDLGAFALSGQAALLRSTRRMTGAATAYTLDGKAVNLELIRKILAGQGVFTLLGNDALFEIIRMLRVEPGAFLIDGKRATFIYDIPSALDFHTSLARLLYPEMIERERKLLFGEDSTVTLYAVSPATGDEVLITLQTYWSARRIPTIESGAEEQWRMEITSNLVNWEMLKRVATVLITPDTGEVQRYKVLQTENAMKPGHVYHLRLEAIDQL